MSLSALLFVLASLISASLGKSIPSTVGPYLVVLERIEDCVPATASKVNLRLSHFKPSRPSDLQYIWGSYYWAVETDEASFFKVHVSKWSNNQWKENFFVFNFKTKGCSVLRDFLPASKDIVFGVAKSAGASFEKGHCFMPSGSFKVSNRSIKIVLPDVPVMPYGRYRATVNVGSYKKPDLLNCLNAFIQLIPKQK